MNKNNIFLLVLLISLLVVSYLIFHRGESKISVSNPPQKVSALSAVIPANKIEVFVFHATERCISCINIGKYSKATIEEGFPAEFKSGKITFKEVNIEGLVTFRV